MKKNLTFKTAMLLLPGALFALQIEFGGGPQQEQYRGWIQYKGDKVDLKKDLHIEDKTRGFGFIELRHKGKLGFIPLPDIRVAYLDVKSSGTGTVNKSFTFGILTVNVRDRVYSKFKFHQWDITFFYTPLRTKLLNLSWGFGAKVIDFKGYVKSLTTGQSDSKSATIPLPYLYLKAGSEIWFLHGYVKGKGLTAGGNNYFYDIAGALGIHYDFTSHFRISLDGGYRYQKYRVDDVDDVSANVRLKGGFGQLALTLAF